MWSGCWSARSIQARPPHFPALVDGCTARPVLADKGPASVANRADQHQAGLKSGIMFPAARDHPLAARQKQFNRRVARWRWIVEQASGTLKRRFLGARSRDRGCRNDAAERALKATVMNLPKRPTGSHRRQPEPRESARRCPNPARDAATTCTTAASPTPHKPAQRDHSHPTPFRNSDPLTRRLPQRSHGV